MDEQAQSVFEQFAADVNAILSGNLKAMFAYGSAVYSDLHIGYSDLDFFAVVSGEITHDHYAALLEYRKALKAADNKLFGMLEGEFVPEELLAAKEGGNVAYWGTSGERMKTRYDLAGFSMRGLLDNGVLVSGEDVRSVIPYPADEEMLGQVRHMAVTIRKYALVTGEGIHSADWLFLVCQSLYWLKTGGVTCKTKAAEWVKEHFHENWCDELDRALSIRRNPASAGSTENKVWLAGLGPIIQTACDVLERETA